MLVTSRRLKRRLRRRTALEAARTQPRASRGLRSFAASPVRLGTAPSTAEGKAEEQQTTLFSSFSLPPPGDLPCSRLGIKAFRSHLGTPPLPQPGSEQLPQRCDLQPRPSLTVSSLLCCKFPPAKDTGAERGELIWPLPLEEKKGGRNIKSTSTKRNASVN